MPLLKHCVSADALKTKHAFKLNMFENCTEKNWTPVFAPDPDPGAEDFFRGCQNSSFVKKIIGRAVFDAFLNRN